MATVTIRNLDDGVRDALKARGAANGRSMEGEAREILRASVQRALEPEQGPSLSARIHELFGEGEWPGVERRHDRPEPAALDER